MDNNEALKKYFSLLKGEDEPGYFKFALRVHDSVFSQKDIIAAAEWSGLSPDEYCIRAIVEKLARDYAEHIAENEKNLAIKTHDEVQESTEGSDKINR